MSLTNFQIETLTKLRLLLTLTAVEVPDMPDPENWEANVLQLLDLLALGITNIQTGAATSLPWSAITEKPTAFPPETHSHQWSQIQNKPSEYPPESHQHGWTDLTGIPASFPPSLHTHPEYEGALTSVSWADVTGKPLTFPPDTHSHAVTWDSVEGKPSTFAPAAHDHLWANITDRPTSWAWADITGKPLTFPPDTHSHAVTWDSVEGKPSTFAPSAHGHPWTEITDKPATYPPDTHSHAAAWADLTGRPANLTGLAGVTFSSGSSLLFYNSGTGWSSVFLGTKGEALVQADSNTEALSAIQAAPAVHTHGWADITGKPTTFPPDTHSHNHSYTSLTFEAGSGWTNFASGVSPLRVGVPSGSNLVLLAGAITHDSAHPDNGELITTIPAGSRPGGTIYLPCMAQLADGSSTHGVVYVESSGAVKYLKQTASTSAVTYLLVNGQWLAA